jgi:probable HAF family extracellular repeat protein
MDSTTPVQRLLAAGSALFVSRVPAGVFAHGGKVHLSHGWASKTTGGDAMSRHLFLALLVTLGFLLGGRHGAQAASFAFTPLDVPGAISTEARGINPRGQIVGIYADSTGEHGFLYDRGVFTTIEVPGASGTQAFGINPRGQIVGLYFDSTGGQHGFLATPKKK